jgi:hypothetical protein
MLVSQGDRQVVAETDLEDRPERGLSREANMAVVRLLVLADALEDAGCTDTDLLGRCRRSGQHVRGCWVVDLLLGKG